MKIIHVIPTDKPSRLHLWTDENGSKLALCDLEYSHTRNTQNIYITSNEEIKPNVYALINKVLCKTELLEGKIVSRQLVGGATMDICKSEYLEIILTTDQDLIKYGVQAIDDVFLEWFVKNPSCECVEVKSWIKTYEDGSTFDRMDYEIIIPKEEHKQEYQSDCICDTECRGFVNVKCKKPKQETLEEALKGELEFIHNSCRNYDFDLGFKTGALIGANWQQEQIFNLIKELHDNENITGFSKLAYAKCLDIVEQFKNK